MICRLNIVIFVVVSVCLCVAYSRNVENSRTKTTVKDLEHNCEKVRPFFEMRNISVQPFDRPKGAVCRGQCCSEETEDALRLQGQKDFSSLLRHNSRSVQGLLNATATVLQNHVTELASQSENKTLLIFSQVYRRMSVLFKDPLGALYGDIRRYVQINGTQGVLSTTDIDIKASVTNFFTDLFPLVYHHHVADNRTADFSPEYKSCLKQTINEVQPFGDIPRQLGQSLSKSLEATRLLLQAFDIGVEVLNTTDTLLTEEGGQGRGNVECHQALMKMTYCPKCLGLGGNTRPCSGYCLNVLRGCLTKYVAELDSPWNSYVEAIERLVIAVKQHNNEAGVNADAVIRGLDTRISEAIMYAMEKEHEIEFRVKRVCGSTKLSDNKDPSLIDTTTPPTGVTGGKPPRLMANTRVFSPLPSNQLTQFLTSIAKSRGFYGNLADSLCRDDSFAEPKDQHCWNGERIGEYTKTVVDAGLDMQKYNPEVKPTTNLQNLDPRIANLADKLRHVHQMVISSLGAAGLPESDNFMQSDSADGSGSGGGPDFSDDSDDIDPPGGSGSGIGPVVIPTDSDPNPKLSPTIKPPYESPKRPEKDQKTGAASNCSSSTFVVTLVLLLTAVISRY